MADSTVVRALETHVGEVDKSIAQLRSGTLVNPEDLCPVARELWIKLDEALSSAIHAAGNLRVIGIGRQREWEDTAKASKS